MLLRVKPYRRRIAGGAGAVTAVLLWIYVNGLHAAGEGGPIFWFLVYAAVGASLGSIGALTKQNAWEVAPGRLRGGQVWVSGGAWWCRPGDVVALALRQEMVDDVSKVCLYAILRTGQRREIFADDSDAAVARPLAEWLSATADIPIRPEPDR
jgi:hypothetical protein